MKTLGETYPKISNARNAELRLRWGQIILKNDHQEEFWKVKEFLQSQVGNFISGPLMDRLWTSVIIPEVFLQACERLVGLPFRGSGAWPLKDLLITPVLV